MKLKLPINITVGVTTFSKGASINCMLKHLSNYDKNLKNIKVLEPDYPSDAFHEIIRSNSPYAFYLFQWVPYQKDAKQWRLKMLHDVKSFDGRIEYGVWPNATKMGSFNDDEVEFIRISKKQHGAEYEDQRK